MNGLIRFRPGVKRRAKIIRQDGWQINLVNN
jgi:hypothetical protein